MKVSESGYTREELLEIVDTYLAEQSRRWEFIEEKGDGMYVYAENGDRYLDFFAGIAVSSAGNANKKVAKAIADQAANVIHAQLSRQVGREGNPAFRQALFQHFFRHFLHSSGR